LDRLWWVRHSERRDYGGRYDEHPCDAPSRTPGPHLFLLHVLRLILPAHPPDAAVDQAPESPIQRLSASVLRRTGDARDRHHHLL
jgi:hypothetical protein